MAEFVIGADEVGYGAWAGPIVVCAVVAKSDWSMSCLADSKKLSERRIRAAYRKLVRCQDITFSIFKADVDLIDNLGVHKALLATHSAAIREMVRLQPAGEVILDGNMRLHEFPNARSVVRADSVVPAVMAASIIAKFNRDLLMQQLASKFPGYGFESHVGYGVPAHQAALNKYGPCAIHRRTIKPIQALLRGHPDRLFARTDAEDLPTR